MDPRRFDALVSTLAQPRRGVLRFLAGFVAGAGIAGPAAVAAADAPDPVVAADSGSPRCLRLGQGCRRKEGRPCCGGIACKKRRCRCQAGFKACGKERCIPDGDCCDDADCPAGSECLDGRCRCPDGQQPCNGGCINLGRCCVDDDCPGEETCQAGACGCPPGTVPCGNRCIAAGACCDDGDCAGDEVCQDGVCGCPAGTTEIAGRCAPAAATCPIGLDLCGVFPDVEGGEFACTAFPSNLCSAALICSSHAQCRQDELCVDLPGINCIEPQPRCLRLCPTPTGARQGGERRSTRRGSDDPGPRR